MANTIVDNRPRNPEYVRKIQEMYNPEKLRKTENNFYNESESSERSIDDHLDWTENLQAWANKKRKGTYLDPNNRKAIPRSDSPISDFSIELTSCSTPKDPLTNGNQQTPRSDKTNSIAKSRTILKDVNSPRDYLRSRHSANIKKNRESLRFRKDSSGQFIPFGFNPIGFSTPVKSRRNSIIFNLTGCPGPEPNVVNKSNRTLTETNQTNDEKSESATLVPEAPPQQAVVPETQTNIQVPETKEPTQNDPAPVPVSDLNNGQQQAEPQKNLSTYSPRDRILPRPPLPRYVSLSQPNNVPPNATIQKPVPKTPSRIPIPKPRTIELTNAPIVPNTPSETARQTIIVVTSPKSPVTQPSAVVPTAPNMTINVNVSGTTQPKSPQSTNTDNHLNRSKHDAISTNPGSNSKSNNSLLTNDEDSEENQANSSQNGNTSNQHNSSARRRLNYQNIPSVNEPVRRSATFNKDDNATQTIRNDGAVSPLAQRIGQLSTNQNGISSIGFDAAPQSQTFVKPRTSIKNATYDIIQTSESSRLSHKLPCYSLNTVGFLSSINQTENRQSVQSDASRNCMAELPSEARLDSMHITDDNDDAIGNDINQAEAQITNRQPHATSTPRNVSIANEQSEHNSNVIEMVRRLSKKVGSPRVILTRLPEDNWGNVIFTPPRQFQNEDNERIDDSPATCALRGKQIQQHDFSQYSSCFQKSNEEMSLNREVAPRKKRRVNEDLVVIRRSIDELEKRRSRYSSRDSFKPVPRKLASEDRLRGDVSDDNIFGPENNAVDNQPELRTNDIELNVSDQPAATSTPDKSSTERQNDEANVDAEILMNDDGAEMIVVVNTDPMNDDEFSDHSDHLNLDPVPSTSKANPSNKSKKSKNKTKSKSVKKKRGKISNKNSSTGGRYPRRKTTISQGDAFRMHFIQEAFQKSHKNSADGVKSTKPRSRSASTDKRREKPVPASHKEKKASGSHKVKTVSGSHRPEWDAFVVDLTEARLNKEKWWNDMIDIDHENAIETEDLCYVKIGDQAFEWSHTSNIEYKEIYGVKYGFVPAKDQRWGYMRFPPRSNKPFGLTQRELTLFVLQGEFRIQSDKGGANIRAGCEVIIKEGSSYGISNETDDVGVIEITYASEH